MRKSLPQPILTGDNQVDVADLLVMLGAFPLRSAPKDADRGFQLEILALRVIFKKPVSDATKLVSICCTLKK